MYHLNPKFFWVLTVVKASDKSILEVDISDVVASISGSTSWFSKTEGMWNVPDDEFVSTSWRPAKSNNVVSELPDKCSLAKAVKVGAESLFCAPVKDKFSKLGSVK